MSTEHFLSQLICPETHEPLKREGSQLISSSGKKYPMTLSGKPDLFSEGKNNVIPEKLETLDAVKSAFKKKFGKFYVILTNIIAPVMPRIHWGTLQTYWHYTVKKYSRNKTTVIQIGSGNDRINKEIINIDIFDYPETDLIADATKLPFADQSIDGVISFAVLEHVIRPDEFLKEAHRVLKPGGFIITGVPFLQGYHASPSDHFRWTHQGLESWHERFGFKKEKICANAGPTSSLLWILQEWLSITLSFGIGPLYFLWWAIFTIGLMPVKLLDIILIYYPQSYKINSFNIYIGKKGE